MRVLSKFAIAALAGWHAAEFASGTVVKANEDEASQESTKSRPDIGDQATQPVWQQNAMQPFTPQKGNEEKGKGSQGYGSAQQASPTELKESGASAQEANTKQRSTWYDPRTGSFVHDYHYPPSPYGHPAGAPYYQQYYGGYAQPYNPYWDMGAHYAPYHHAQEYDGYAHGYGDYGYGYGGYGYGYRPGGFGHDYGYGYGSFAEDAGHDHGHGYGGYGGSYAGDYDRGTSGYGGNYALPGQPGPQTEAPYGQQRFSFGPQFGYGQPQAPPVGQQPPVMASSSGQALATPASAGQVPPVTPAAGPGQPV